MKNNIRTINNAADLKMEIMRLKQLREDQELKVKESFNELQECISFENITGMAFDAIIKNTKSKSLTHQGINLGAHILADNILFRNKGSVTRFLAENAIRIAAKLLIKKTTKDATE